MAFQTRSFGEIFRQSPVRSNGTRAAQILYIALALLSGLGLLGKSSLIAMVAHVPRIAAFAGVGLALCLCLFWRMAMRFSKILGPVFLGLLLITFVVMYPKMEKLRQIGRGSDQADCVVLAANKMAHGSWPYVRADMSSKNAMSCGPGWVALQVPAIEALGYRGDVVLCWALSVLVLVLRLGWRKTAIILTLIGLCAIVWLAAANGTDFLTFGIVLLAFSVAVESNQTGQRAIYWAVASVVLGLLAQFRIVTLLIPGTFVKRMPHPAVLVAWVIATGCQIGFLVWNVPAFVNDGPLHIAAKLMRGSVMSDRPMVAALELLLISIAASALSAVLVIRKWSRQPLLLVLVLVFLVPGLEDFAIKFQLFGNINDVLSHWEGGMWLTACIPLAAAGLVFSSETDSADSTASS